MIYGCIRPEDGHTSKNRIVTVPPAIYKPEMLWTGKQVITTVLLNIKPDNVPGVNLISKTKLKVIIGVNQVLKMKLFLRMVNYYRVF